MKKIDKLIPFADVAIRNLVIAKNNESYIPKEFNGYISSFGAAVIQSGLIAALYSNHQTGDSAADRRKLMDVVFEVVKKKRIIPIEQSNILIYARSMESDSVKIRNLKKDILDSATAIKLVIRTYNLKKS